MKNELIVRSEMYVDGKWIQTADQKDVYNPATGEVITRVAQGGATEAERSVEAAYAAFATWSSKTGYERSLILHDIYSLILQDADRLARILTMEQGKPLEEARGEVLWGAEFVRWYAEEARRVYGDVIPGSHNHQKLLVQRKPIGVVAAITPWNFPSAMITRKLAPALAAGCTVVLKPAPETPLSAIAMFEQFEKAGLPAGVANLVMGDAEKIGEVWMNSPKVRKVSFTGSTGVGKKLIAQSAATIKKLSLELGGHAPFIVFEDADLDRAVDGLIANKFENNGQTCICANRIFVHRQVAEAFTSKALEKIRQLKIGNGLEPGVQVGPLINKKALDKVRDHIQDAVEKDASLLYGGNLIEELNGEKVCGNFITPAVLTGIDRRMKMFYEETFGPVVPITTFDSEDEVVALANDTKYGLAVYFYSRDIGRIMRVADQLDYGMIGINASSLGYPQAPFGGIKESGMGREGGKYGLDDFLELKYMNLSYE